MRRAAPVTRRSRWRAAFLTSTLGVGLVAATGVIGTHRHQESVEIAESPVAMRAALHDKVLRTPSVTSSRGSFSGTSSGSTTAPSAPTSTSPSPSAPITPAPITPAPITPAPITPAPITSSPSAAAPLTSAAPGQALATSSVPGMRDVPGPLYGVTVDDVTNSSAIVASSQHLAHRPTTRVVFDKGVGPSYYKPAVQAMEPSSYVMGEILDSSDVQSVPTDVYRSRTGDYVSQLGNDVDIWEVGNEINGEWLGSTSDVVAKMTGAYDIVKAAGKRTALTLFYEPDCGSLADHEMFTWAQNNVPTRMKQSLDYVLVSYYEQDCNNVRPTQAQWQGVFDRLRGMFPTARLGFGEVGLVDPATSSTQTRAADTMNYYYHLQISTPGYVGGYFWWSYYEDCLPWSSKPMWQTLNSALTSMPTPTA